MSKKAKLIRTQYHNYWTNEIEEEKPYGVLGDDYWVLRKGMVFNVYSEPDEVKKICDDLDIPNDYEVICIHDNGKPKKKYMFCLNEGLREMRRLYKRDIIQCGGCRCAFYSNGCGRMELQEWEKNNAN